VIEGITKAESLFDISVGIIGVLDRTMAPEHEEEVLDFFIQNKETIIGIDIANDERFSCLPFAPLYKKASEAGLGLTCHAGESTGGAPSVWEAVDGLKVTRVGHGFRAFEDPEVVELLVKREVVLEFCPISNVRTGSVASFEVNPIRGLMDAGVKVCVNTDDPGMFGTDIIDEYEVCVKYYQFTEADFYRCNLDALNSSFLTKEKKDRVREKYFNRPVGK
jgi:adenosine deaminase